MYLFAQPSNKRALVIIVHTHGFYIQDTARLEIHEFVYDHGPAEKCTYSTQIFKISVNSQMNFKNKAKPQKMQKQRPVL